MGIRVKAPADIAALVRSRRKELGWDQAELARRIGTNRRWVSELENAKPTVALHLVLKTLNALGIDILTEARPATQPGNDVPTTDKARWTPDRPVQRPSANERSLEEQIRRVEEAMQTSSAYATAQRAEEVMKASSVAEEILNRQLRLDRLQSEARLLDDISKGRS